MKYTRKQRAEKSKVENSEKSNFLVGLEKFAHYAGCRGIYMKPVTYGIYKVVHNGKTSEEEAVRAARNDEKGGLVKGWIINLGGKQRVFKPDSSRYKVYPLKSSKLSQ